MSIAKLGDDLMKVPKLDVAGVVVKKIFTWVYRIRIIIRIYQLFVGV